MHGVQDTTIVSNASAPGVVLVVAAAAAAAKDVAAVAEATRNA